MILIINSDIDYTGDQVCLWLRKQQKKFCRISATIPITYFLFDDTGNIVLKIAGTDNKLKLADITSVFYRNGDLSYQITTPVGYEAEDSLTAFNNKEWSSLKEYLKFIISSRKKVIGNLYTSMVNKLMVLHIAQEVGLKTPATNIVCEKEALKHFKKDKANIITKPISEAVVNSSDVGRFFNYTRIITDNEVIPNCFAPSLIQEYVEKKYEIRTFFLQDKFWSIAIFSQAQQQTLTDYRNYNFDNENRCEPFLLPESITIKIQELAKRLGFTTGSVDFIYSTNCEFIFLEINPVGQFSNVSRGGNYFIEKYISEQL